MTQAVSRIAPVREEQGAELSVMARSRFLGEGDVIPVLLLAAAVGALFFTSPYHADIWWSDASRHAMDGAFYRDFVRHLPLSHLKQFAMSYYVK